MSTRFFTNEAENTDIKRWHVEFADQYLIKIESSENVDWFSSRWIAMNHSELLR